MLNTKAGAGTEQCYGCKSEQPTGYCAVCGIKTCARGQGYEFCIECSDSYIKLIYLRSRMYDPYLNQFIQPDTIVPDPYISADWNKYAYVRNNPVNYTGKIDMIIRKDTRKTLGNTCGL
jgi:RHS repeat-associated protein